MSSSGIYTVFSCTTCGVQYSRLEDVIRHASSHIRTRPFRCSRCGHTYKRKDVLERHSRTCLGLVSSNVFDNALQQLELVGTSQLQDHFAANFSHGGQPASVDPYLSGFWHPPINQIFPYPSAFDFVSSIDIDQPPWDATPISLPANEVGVQGTTATASTVPDFDVLVNVAERTRWDQILDVGSRTQRQKVIERSLASLAITQRGPTSPVVAMKAEGQRMASPSSSPAHAPSPSSSIPLEANTSRPITAPISNTTVQQDIIRSRIAAHLLELKRHDIVMQLQKIASQKSSESAQHHPWFPMLEYQCSRFFSIPNMCKFIDLFWSSVYPSLPIIHKPTFDLRNISTCLFTVLLLLGASVSTDSQDVLAADSWMNSLEEWVYKDEDFHNAESLRMDPRNLIDLRPQIQCFQAAFFISAYQFYNGTTKSVMRVRGTLLHALVTGMRNLRLLRTRHGDLSRASSMDWNDFVMREEIIRLTAWLTVLEGTYSIFRQTPTYVKPKEFLGDFICPDPIFQAETVEEWNELVQVWTQHRTWNTRLPISLAVEYLCLREPPPQILETLTMIGQFNHGVLIMCLHFVIFQLEHSFTLDFPLEPVLHALRHWIRIWGKGVQLHPPNTLYTYLGDSESPEKMWKGPGICKHSREVYMVNLRMIGRIRISRMRHAETLAAGSPPTEDDPTESSEREQESIRQAKSLLGLV